MDFGKKLKAFTIHIDVQIFLWCSQGFVEGQHN